MKHLVLFSIFIAGLTSISTFAATITSGKLSSTADAIELEVRYGGGYYQHNFTLERKLVLETNPQQYVYTLIDSGAFDPAEMLYIRTVKIMLSDYGFDQISMQGKSIQIKGDESSSVTIVLPNESSSSR